MGVVGNNSRMGCPRVSRDLVLRNLKNISFLVIFSIFPFGWGGPKKVRYLPTSPNNKFQDHSHQNRLKKLVPRAYSFATGFRKSLNDIHQILFKTWLSSEILVSQNQGLVSGSPPGGVYSQRMTPKQNKYPQQNEKPNNLLKTYILPTTDIRSWFSGWFCCYTFYR